MAGNPKKKSTGIVNAAIGALAVVLAILIVWMMNLVSGIQGTARIINYAGLVRGKTQRIVKLEISGQPQDGMIADIDAFIAGLRFGSDELSLVRLNDDAFQSKMQELDDYFQALKQEIGRVRAVGSNNTDIIPHQRNLFRHLRRRDRSGRGVLTAQGNLAFRSGEVYHSGYRRAHAADWLPAVSGAAHGCDEPRSAA